LEFAVPRWFRTRSPILCSRWQWPDCAEWILPSRKMADRPDERVAQKNHLKTTTVQMCRPFLPLSQPRWQRQWRVPARPTDDTHCECQPISLSSLPCLPFLSYCLARIGCLISFYHLHKGDKGGWLN
jgi:hypothetical protein